MSEMLKERLFFLLRSAMYARSAEEFSIFNGIDDEQWEELMTTAKRHGLKLLITEALDYLPSQYHPSLKVKATWAFAVINAEDRFEHYKQTLEELAKIMSDSEISILLMKGLTVASLYPNPARREGGDIDMFLLGDKNKGDAAIRSLGVAIDQDGEGYKHSHFVFNGIDVERHNTFIEIDHYIKKYRRQTERINEIILGSINEGRLSEMTIGSQKVFMLEPKYALLFMIAHAMGHIIFVDGGIRQYSDIAIYIKYYRDQLDAEWFKERFEECGMSKFVANMEYFCVHRLGMKPFFNLDYKDIETGEFSLENVLLRFRLVPNIISSLRDPKELIDKLVLYRRLRLAYLGIGSYVDFVMPRVIRRAKAKKQTICTSKQS